MAPLEPLAGTFEPLPTSAVEPPATRQRALSISSYTAQTHLSNSITSSLRSAGAPSTTSTTGIHALTARLGLGGLARRTLGITLLLVTVFLWTLSNFLASYIFSDHTYDKPFFVVYINTSVFALSLVPMLARFLAREGMDGVRREAGALLVRDSSKSGRGRRSAAASNGNKEHSANVAAVAAPDEEYYGLLAGRNDSEDNLVEEGEVSSSSGTFEVDDTPEFGGGGDMAVEEKLSLRATAVLSLEFCMLWFCANYFASACLEYTSVGSVTILTSTSSVWTLVFCAVMGVDTFTVRKLVGVLASLAGVVLISTVDLSGASDEDRGNFPHKSQTSIAIGDGMAFFSAIVYGLYVTVMKRRVGDEDRVNMQLFFGLVGLFNLVLLWPGFFVLHWTQIEPFGWPPSGKVWLIIILNSISSFISDMSWAYAMLLTTPLVVTVGLSLTIPLSLIGEMIQYEQYSSWIYWVGAGIVLMSFLFINHESTEGEDKEEA
ncbi:unnamed protein product [Discula destructiva]